VLPMQLQIGDRLTDEMGVWESSADRTHRQTAKPSTLRFSVLVSSAARCHSRGARKSALR
jgi:hypothetical protein